jgi:hypothetical protein
MEMQAEDICRFMRASAGLALDLLPEEQGLYGLLDHTGKLRYVGMTTMPLKRRIAQYHVAGDGNSHKYSCAYNAGLLWHDRKHPLTDEKDGRLAKKARREFVRATCRAVTLPLPNLAAEELQALERKVIDQLADHLDWNDSKIIPAIDVDDLVKGMTSSWSEDDKQAMERQRTRWMEGRNT